MRNPPTSLNPSELAIMKEIWEVGKATVREVHDRLAPRSGWAYSTTKTVMERMVRKGILLRKDFHGVFLYEAEVSRAQGLATLARDFADRVLGVDSQALVPLFAESGSLSPAELEELEALLERGDEP
ncbi:MAG: BlaI/MecI/CopY family transcriptional regulator [Acidobacteria bacterium]|nr:BlaI/MecI/CopY family transcriptional regulator [Acidobacteriota bacterium]